MKKIFSFAVALFLILSMLPMNQTTVQAAESSTLLSEKGTLSQGGEARYQFPVTTVSKVTVTFSECSGGKYEFEIINAQTGEEIFNTGSTAQEEDQDYTFKLQAGDYILSITQDDKEDFSYQVEVKAEIAKKVDVSSVSLNASSVTLGIGNKYELKAVITPYNATNKEIDWKSSNYKVANVDEDGEVEGISSGKATITAKVDGKTVKCTVYIINTYYEINVKGTRSLASNFRNIKDYKKGKWSTSNKSVVSVSSSGKITGLKQGTSKITLTVGGKKYVTTIYVYDKKNLRIIAERKLKKLLDNPETLIIEDVHISKNRVIMQYIAIDEEGKEEKGTFVGYYSKGRFKYYIDD